MSAWGTGLYAGDFAADLRSTVGAVVRLPFDVDRLVQILCDTEPGVANDSSDPDYTIFWLVLADQFFKRGLSCQRVRDEALKIIDTGQDIAMLETLGMTRSDLRKRRKTLVELRERLVSPNPPAKALKTLKEPQPFLMEIGDLLVFPTCRGECINPYFSDEELKKFGEAPDGWGSAVIIDRGRAFDFLSWYRPLTLVDSASRKPDRDGLHSPMKWVLRNPGTCSASHFRRMRLEKVDQLTINESRLRQYFPDLISGVYAAVNDISISNEFKGSRDLFTLQVQSEGEYARVAFPTVASLSEIASR